MSPGDLATIWRGGCIIRDKFLDRIREAHAAEPDLTTLMTQEYFAQALKDEGAPSTPSGPVTSARSRADVPPPCNRD